jgi:hypothetical protein
MTIAQNAALTAHPFVLEDGPVLPIEPGPQGKLEENSWRRCTLKAVHRLETHEYEKDQEGQEDWTRFLACSPAMPALFRRSDRLCQRDYYTSANHDNLHTATRKRGLRCIQPPLGALTT